jgi:hypothetical protein
MKDFKRIDRILKKLRIVWRNCPSLRLGQLVQFWGINPDSKDNKPEYYGDSFELPDERLEEQLDLWIKTNNFK